MIGRFTAIVIGLALLIAAAPQDDPAATTPFEAWEIWIDTGDQPLAAYQLDIAADPDTIAIIGIEGSSAEPYRDPPYYDPAAMMNDRVIIGDYSTAAAEALPRGRFRIATLHTRHTGATAPTFTHTIDVAIDPGGDPISDVTITIQRGVLDS